MQAIQSLIVTTLMVSSIALSAQIEVLTMPTQSATITTSFKTTSQDTLQLPFVDGFAHGLRPEWTNHGVMVNSHWALDALSTDQAVFDGIAADGQAYLVGTLPTDSLTDVLLSPYFDLSGLSNVVLSFHLQQGGKGDPTEVSDSMVVDFLNPSDSTWHRAWDVPGSAAVDQWLSAAMVLPIAVVGKQAVRFRLARKGAPGGAFDHFLIDYLEFAAGRNLADTLIEDPSWIEIPPSITQVFHELPWFHYQSTVVEADSLAMAYRRNGPVPVGGWQLNLGKYQWVDGNGSVLASRLSVPVVTNLQHDIRTPYVMPIAQPNVSPTGPFSWDMTIWFDGENVGERANDSMRVHQLFGDRYALDDGHAERTYGVIQGQSPRMAQRFNFLQSDTLKGVDLAFVPAGYDWTGMTFQLAIWGIDTLNLPGQLLYLSDSLYQPAIAYPGQTFAHYVLDTAGLVVPSVCYIGWIQSTGPALTMGLDMDHLTTKAYGDVNGWFTSLLPGTLQIRPFFRGIPQDLSAGVSKPSPMAIYPIPSTGRLHVEGYDGPWVCMDLQGRIQCQGKQIEQGFLHLEALPPGHYVLVFRNGIRQQIVTIQP